MRGSVGMRRGVEKRRNEKQEKTERAAGNNGHTERERERGGGDGERMEPMKVLPRVKAVDSTRLA